METTIPVSITVIGHPLIQFVTVAWSANTGMVPIAVSFSSEGGTAESRLTSENPEIAQIQCQAKVSFAIPNWDIIHTNLTRSVSSGGDHIVIDPGGWIRYLNLQFEIANDNAEALDTSIESEMYSASNRDHLVINVNWQAPHLPHPIKTSHRINPHQSWQVPYLLFPEGQTELTLSAFGVVSKKLIRIPSRSLWLEHPQPPCRSLVLLVKDTLVQVIDEPD